MDERALFLEALDKDPAERAALLDSACAGDEALRRRIDSLLKSHTEAGDFLGKLAPERIAEELALDQTCDETQCNTEHGQAEQELSFLAPSEKPNVLGRLGHYDIQEVIGRGGMGIVLRAFDEKLHRIVAIKVMASQLATNATARKRFSREAQAQAAVSHDHIVTIHAVEDAELPSPLGGEGPGVRGLPYLVMQYVSGQSLQQRIDRDGALELHEILRIGMQTASGLAAAHAQGLVHRDIKPANILLENGVERVKITDFGLARAATEASLTQSGIIAGTPQFMSPEQAEGKAIDQRTDLFSLGSVLYAMCTGRAPFRASGTLAVLKRVCEETPTPIRQSNPDIPDWLVATIEKLQAKNPAERFQSAAEVAALLGRHLAQVQHPSVVGHVSNVPAEDKEARSKRAPRHGWAMAAAMLLLLLGGLSVTEATGVTNLRATVIRIFTPDGTLVVETDDPSVKVTVEGDGGLSIGGAGLQEIRLRPGSYKLHADRDGKPVPLERNLVSISNGGREVVKVKLEGTGAPAAAAAATKVGKIAPAAAAPTPFVLLDGVSGSESKFATLAEAVQSAYDGDTIEVRGNGPFVIEPIDINQALAIRAGAGFRPGFLLSPRDGRNLLTTSASLVLEGLDFQFAAPADSAPLPWSPATLLAGGHSLHVAKCRFQARPGANHACIETNTTTTCVIRDSLFLNSGHVALQMGFPPSKSYSVENCVFLGNIVARAGIWSPVEGTEITLKGNTFLAPPPNQPGFLLAENGISPKTWKVESMKRIPVRASSNIFDGLEVMYYSHSEDHWKELPREADSCLTRVFSWEDRDNLYSLPLDQPFWGTNAPEQEQSAPRRLAEWKQLWNDPDAKCQEGHVRFRGGDLGARLATAPEQITLDDFRLRADSAGYHAGQDGKDLGANVDTVGPGQAYDDWKKTPEYVQWQKQSGQKSKGPPPESKAFALIGGAGVPEQRFDTLSEAILASSSGDAIEVRGNGPFTSDAVTINHKLTIRAGQGVRPVIYFVRRSPPTGFYLLHNTAHLTLEGLEFRIRSKYEGALVYAGRALNVTNCRFYVPGLNVCIWSGAETRRCTLRNSEFAAFMALEGGQTDGEWVIENCVYAAGAVAVYDPGGGPPSGTVRISHVSVVSSGLSAAVGYFPASLAPAEKKPEFRVSESVLGSGAMLSVRRTAPVVQENGEPLTPESFAGALPKLMNFAGTRNVYVPPDQAEVEYVMSWDGGDGGIWRHDLKTLEAWKKLWGSPETDCIQSRVKFANGDLVAKIARDPENVTPEDYRLRADSPGYRAGADGKDLGADVDLVGPGAAYERWKKTPEYQQWLTDTRQRQRPVAKPEPGAFVLLGDKGVEVGKYDALSVAVERASSGDTIEIRGNGPFLSDAIRLGTKALTIRAGAGFAPVIEPSQTPVKEFPLLLGAEGTVILEGLELHIPQRSAYLCLVGSNSAPLYLANCKLVVDQGRHGESRWAVDGNNALRGQMRNCLLVAASTGIMLKCQPGMQWTIDNCLSATLGDALYVGPISDDPFAGTKLRLSRNTILTRYGVFSLSGPSEPVGDQLRAGKSFVPAFVEVEGNICQAGYAFYLNSESPKHPRGLPISEQRQAISKLIRWQEHDNVYSLANKAFVGLHGSVDAPGVVTWLLKDQAGWNAFWGLKDTATTMETVRLRNDPSALLEEAPEDILPDDFRLRDDSAGFRAGPDGKDLGADVDVVGPGAAYERWKTTPEYQQWLKDSGQGVTDK